jgi:hypothetical protein
LNSVASWRLDPGAKPGQPTVFDATAALEHGFDVAEGAELGTVVGFDLRRAEKAPTTWFMDALAHLGSFQGGRLVFFRVIG